MIKIEKITKNDIENISILMYKIILQEEQNKVSIKGMNTMLNFYSSEEITKRYKCNDNNFYKFISEENTFMGFGEIENNHIVSLYIKKEYRKNKIGKRFLEFIINKKRGEKNQRICFGNSH